MNFTQAFVNQMYTQHDAKVCRSRQLFPLFKCWRIRFDWFLLCTLFFYFPPIGNMEGKSSTKTVRFLHFLANSPGRFVEMPNWIWIFFITKLYQIFLECDWNSQISQNVQNLGIFEKNRFFSKKSGIFQNRIRWQIYSRMRSKWSDFFKLSFPP